MSSNCWFFKPTLRNPFIIFWFPDELCLLFHISNFIGRRPTLTNRYWLENEDFILLPEKTLKKLKKANRQLFFYSNSPLWSVTPTYSGAEVSPEKNHFCKKRKQWHQIRYLDLFVSCRESFEMNTRSKNTIVVDEDSSSSQQSPSSPLVFDSVQKQFFSITDSSKKFWYCTLWCSYKLKERFFYQLCG